MPNAQSQQHGISRSRFHPRPLKFSRHELPGSREDVAALSKAVDALSRDIDGLFEAMDSAATRASTDLDVSVDALAERLNQMILSGTLAERPAAGVADRIYLVVLNHTPGPLYFDDGTQWILVGSPSQETQSAVLLDGAVSHTFDVAQDSAIYAPAISTTWWTMVKIVSQAAGALVLEFSNPASAGDVVTVSIP